MWDDPRPDHGVMSSRDTPAESETPVDPAPVPGRRRGLAAFAAFNAFWAWAGAVGLIGGGLDFGEQLNRRLPFDSLVLAGLALATIVAVPLTVLAWMAWRGDPRTGRASVLVGIVLVGWILVQLCFLREPSFFHPLYLAIGAGFIVAGRRSPPLANTTP